MLVRKVDRLIDIMVLFYCSHAYAFMAFLGGSNVYDGTNFIVMIA